MHIHVPTDAHLHIHTHTHTLTQYFGLCPKISTLPKNIETSSKTADTYVQPSLIRSCSLYSGPGSYNMFDCGLAQESVKRATLESSRKGGFGCHAQRNSVFHNVQTLDAPGPGQYVVGSSLSVRHLPIGLPPSPCLSSTKGVGFYPSVSIFVSLPRPLSFTLPASLSINISPTVPANVARLANSYPQIRAMT